MGLSVVSRFLKYLSLFIDLATLGLTLQLVGSSSPIRDGIGTPPSIGEHRVLATEPPGTSLFPNFDYFE